jgi:GNAT superfamily N-acetyltransferase
MAQSVVEIFDRLPPERQAPFDRLQAEAFSWIDAGETPQAEMMDRFCSDADMIGYALALEDGEPVGGALLFRRAIPFQGRTLTLGGLGGVATRSDRLRRGIASAVVAAAMDELRRRGCDIAYLCTDIARLGGLYGRAGFVPLGRPHTYLGRSGRRYTDNDGMIAPINSPALFAAVLADRAPFDIGVGNW